MTFKEPSCAFLRASGFVRLKLSKWRRLTINSDCIKQSEVSKEILNLFPIGICFASDGCRKWDCHLLVWSPASWSVFKLTTCSISLKIKQSCSKLINLSFSSSLSKEYLVTGEGTVFETANCSGTWKGGSLLITSYVYLQNLIQTIAAFWPWILSRFCYISILYNNPVGWCFWAWRNANEGTVNFRNIITIGIYINMFKTAKTVISYHANYKI